MAGQDNQALVQVLQMILSQLGGNPEAGRAAAGIAPAGPSAPAPTPAPPPAPAGPSDEEMYGRFGLDKNRLMFMQQLADFMAGMKFRQRALQSALQGKAGLFGDEGVMPGLPATPGGLSQYA